MVPKPKFWLTYVNVSDLNAGPLWGNVFPFGLRGAYQYMNLLLLVQNLFLIGYAIEAGQCSKEIGLKIFFLSNASQGQNPWTFDIHSGYVKMLSLIGLRV